MKGLFRLILLAAIVGTIVVMVKVGTPTTFTGGAFVILILLALYRKTVKPRARNHSYGSGGSSRSLPSYSEVMQTINDYVGYYASSFNCNITPNHIYISITFNPDTSAALASQKASDLCNELSSTYGIGVSVN